MDEARTKMNVDLDQRRVANGLEENTPEHDVRMVEAIAAAVDKKELPPMDSGTRRYMLSRQGYLSDRDRHGIPT